MDQTIKKLFSTQFGEQEVSILDQITHGLTQGYEKNLQAENIWRKLSQDPSFCDKFNWVMRYSQNEETKSRMVSIAGQTFQNQWISWVQQKREGYLQQIEQQIRSYCLLKEDDQNFSKQKTLQGLNKLYADLAISQMVITSTLKLSNFMKSCMESIRSTWNMIKILSLISSNSFPSIYGQGKVNVQQLKKYLSECSQALIDLFSKILQQRQFVDKDLIDQCLSVMAALIPYCSHPTIMDSDIHELITSLISSHDYLIKGLECVRSLAWQTVSGTCIRTSPLITAAISSVIKTISTEYLVMSSQQIQNQIRYNSTEKQLYMTIINTLSKIYMKPLKQLKHLFLNQQKDAQTFQEGLIWLANWLYIDDEYSRNLCSQTLNKILSHNLEGDEEFEYSNLTENLIQIIPATMSKPKWILMSSSGELIPQPEPSSSYEVMKILLQTVSRLEWMDLKNHILQIFEKLLSYETLNIQEMSKIIWTMGALTDRVMDNDEDDFVYQIIEGFLKLDQTIDRQGEDSQRYQNLVNTAILFIASQNICILNKNDELFKIIFDKIFELLQNSHHPKPMRMMNIHAIDRILQSLSQQQEQQSLTQFAEKITKVSYKVLRAMHPQLIAQYMETIGHMMNYLPNHFNKIGVYQKIFGFYIYQFFGIIDSASTNPQIFMEHAEKMKILFMITVNKSFFKGIDILGAMITQRLMKDIMVCVRQIHLFYTTKLQKISKKEGIDGLEQPENIAVRQIQKQCLRFFIEAIKKCEDLPKEKKDEILFTPFGNLPKKFEQADLQLKDPEIINLFTIMIKKINESMHGKALLNLIRRVLIPHKQMFVNHPTLSEPLYQFVMAIIDNLCHLLLSIKIEGEDAIFDYIQRLCNNQTVDNRTKGFDLINLLLNRVNENSARKNGFFENRIEELMDIMVGCFVNHGYSQNLNLILKIIYSIKLATEGSSDFEHNLKKNILNYVEKVNEEYASNFAREISKPQSYLGYRNQMIELLIKTYLYSPLQISKVYLDERHPQEQDEDDGSEQSEEGESSEGQGGESSGSE